MMDNGAARDAALKFFNVHAPPSISLSSIEGGSAFGNGVWTFVYFPNVRFAGLLPNVVATARLMGFGEVKNQDPVD